MNIFFEKLTEYCENHTTNQSQILYELERETYLKTLAPQMLSGHLQGRFLSMISQMMRPRRILEIGTFTGYAALCLAEGLAEDGILHTIEVKKELGYLINKYIEKAGFQNKIKSHIGDAKKIIPSLDEVFDMVMIDAGKMDNEFYFEMILKKVRTGGVILVDNVLWSGKVVENKNDKDTKTINAFSKKMHDDSRIENLILPIRDGMMMLRKR